MVQIKVNYSYSFSLAVLLSFALSILCSFIIYRIGHRVSLIDIPAQRSSHLNPTPRGGGVGIWLSFIVAGLLFTNQVILTIIAGVVGLIGFADDRFTLSSKVRLIFQIILSAAVVFLLSGLPEGVITAVLFFIAALFITGTSNFYNFMDGINGIAGLTGVVGFGLLSYFAFFISNQPGIALMSASLASACLGFLPFNLARAKVFMGDVGSVFLGFVFGSFVVKLSVNINVFLCLVMFLSTFYADAIVTIFQRWRKGEDLMTAHRYHLYQYLSNELKLQHWAVSVIYVVVQTTFGLLALSAYRNGLCWQLSLLSIFSIMFLASYKIIKGISPVARGTTIN